MTTKTSETSNDLNVKKGYAQLHGEQLIQLLGKLFSSASLWLGPGGIRTPDLWPWKRSALWPLSHRTYSVAGGNCINSLPAVKSTTYHGVCAVPYLRFKPFELFQTWKINNKTSSWSLFRNIRSLRSVSSWCSWGFRANYGVSCDWLRGNTWPHPCDTNVSRGCGHMVPLSQSQLAP